MSENSQVKKDTKPVETLILANCGSKKDCKNNKLNKESVVPRKEDEKIITKVMTIIEGYDWNLVQPEKKSSSEVKKEHIKRPMNAFMVWAQAARKVMSKQHPHLQNSELSKSLGKLWKGLDKADRQPFIDHAEKLRTNHKQEHPDYKYQPRRKKSKLMNNITSINNTSNIQSCSGNSMNLTKSSKINSKNEITKNCLSTLTSSSELVTSIPLLNKRICNTQNSRNDKIKKGNTINNMNSSSITLNQTLNDDNHDKSISIPNIHTKLQQHKSMDKLSNGKNILESKINQYNNSNIPIGTNLTNSSICGNFMFSDDRLSNKILDNTITYEGSLWKGIEVKNPDIIRKLDCIRQIGSPCSTSSSLVSSNEPHPLTPPATPYATSSMNSIGSNSTSITTLTSPVQLIKRTSPELQCTTNANLIQPFVSPNQIQQQQQQLQQQHALYCDYNEFSRMSTTIQTPSTSSSSGSSIDNQSFLPFDHESYLNCNNPFQKSNNICSVDSSYARQSYIPHNYHQITSYGQQHSNLNDCGILSPTNSNLTSYTQCSVTPSTTPTIASGTYANYSIPSSHHNHHQQQLHHQQQHQLTTSNQLTQNFLAPIDTDYVDPKEIDQYLVDAPSLTVAMHHQQNQIHNHIKIPRGLTCNNNAAVTLPLVTNTSTTTKSQSQISSNASSILATTTTSITGPLIPSTTNSMLYNRIYENNLLELQRVDNKCMNENLNKINLANTQGAIQILNHSTGKNLTNNLQDYHNVDDDDDDDDDDVDDDEDVVDDDVDENENVGNTNKNNNNNNRGSDGVEYYQSSNNNNNNNNSSNNNNNNNKNNNNNSTNYSYAIWNYNNS